MHPEFPPIAFIAATSILLVLPWHWRAGNVATVSIALWLFVTNVIYGVDALVWGNNVNIVIPVWCDITTKILIGSNVALPAACLCVCLHLERVASVRLTRTSISDKRRRQIFEGLMCFGLPGLIMVLHYVVQGHRFDIIEEYGCRPTTYFSIPGIFIVWLPPLLMSIMSLVFAALALRHFFIRRVTFARLLDASNSALTTSRYLRLMLMSATQMIWSVAITSYSLWFTTISIPIRPWTNWADVHSDFSRIDVYVTAFTPQLIVTTYYALWWAVPASTFIFVAFFAFGRDAVDEYKKCLRWIGMRIFRQKSNSQEKNGAFGLLPTMSSVKRGPISAPKISPPSPKSMSTISSIPPYKSLRSDASTNATRTLDDTDTQSTYSYETKTLSSPSPSAVKSSTSAKFPPSDGLAGSPTISSIASPTTSSIDGTFVGLRSPSSPRPFTYPSAYHVPYLDLSSQFPKRS